MKRYDSIVQLPDGFVCGKSYLAKKGRTRCLLDAFSIAGGKAWAGRGCGVQAGTCLLNDEINPLDRLPHFNSRVDNTMDGLPRVNHHPLTQRVARRRLAIFKKLISQSG